MFQGIAVRGWVGRPLSLPRYCPVLDIRHEREWFIPQRKARPGVVRRLIR
nr:MAG TPA: hypothetical protein [Caudoviricetes sp.]